MFKLLFIPSILRIFFLHRFFAMSWKSYLLYPIYFSPFDGFLSAEGSRRVHTLDIYARVSQKRLCGIMENARAPRRGPFSRENGS